MSSIRPQDRASLCTFTFADGRRCRTPLSSLHPRLCYDHARNEAQAHAPDPVRPDLSIFFSGEHVSAHDLSVAIVGLLPELALRQFKPKTSLTFGHLSRTLLRSIQLSQHEFIRTHVEDFLPRAPRRQKKPLQKGPALTHAESTLP